MRLHEWLDKPNLYVKIPATKPGLGAIEDCIAHGKSINVTLIFSLQRYREVVEAYLRGLERLVASRRRPVDGALGRELLRLARRHRGRQAPRGRRHEGGARAARQARDREREARVRALPAGVRSGPRWEFLAGKGATPQRCLWASTSTKNPDYRDVIYVEELIGPDTVNTMPEETIRAFQDHGEVRGDTVTEDVAGAHTLLEEIAKVGVDYDDVTETLELEGVQKFADSFEELLDGVRAKRGELAAA